MKKKYILLSRITTLFLFFSASVLAQQVPNPSFEDWSGEKFDGNIQPKDWYVSNISQAGLNFNLANREGGHSGSYSLMVKDTEVGAFGITELSPGYFSLGKPWSYIDGLNTNTATAGTSGGIGFSHRPDTMSVWIKRVGPNVDKEDFYLLYYAWSGTAKGDSYKAKDGSCASVSQTNEESDIRLALDANECGTAQKANQIAEGMWREKKEYGEWTNIRVPIYYFNDEVPTMMNIIFSASNYPNFRESIGLYKDHALYVDDIEFIYSSKIDKLYIQGKEWKDFDPNSAEEQVYSVSEGTEMPDVYGVRGVGSITNARGNKATFSGRKLTSEEFQIVQQGTINGDPMIIQVNATDGSSTTTYKIKFVSASSTPNTIIYELNGGITNDYGWMSKNDMFQACMADAGVTGLPSLAELKGQADPVALIATPFVTERCQAILDNAKWDWLEAYILSVQNADANAYPLTEGAASAGWRYAIAAFFLESQRTSWPISADFSLAGKYEVFQPTWKHSFDNPTEPTSDWVLNAPYKEGYTFVGWYTTPDFSGNKVTVVNAETSGTLYAKWIEYVPTIAEVKALADDSETKVAGVVNFISGKNVYIQDATGGILVYTAETPDFNVGDKIIVKGVKVLYGGAPEVKNAVVESSESSDLFDVTVFEDLSLLLSDTEFAYFGTRIAVNGVKIVSYDSYYNPTVEDLLGNQAVCYKMVLDPIIYPIGTKVSVTAVAGWYKGFLFVGDVSGIEKVVAAKQDNYNYPVRDNKYSLANNWVISNNEDNFAANKPGNTDVVRGMGINDGIMYFINRETESLVRVDAATGTMLAPLKITGDHLFQVQGEDGTYTDAVIYKFNDLKFDNAGNCLIGAMVSSGTKCQPFIVYSVNLETGVATELINDVLWDNPDIDGIQFRFDAFGVYGDVTKNAVVMAADQSSWNVFRWQIKNGVVGKGELISIELDPERDNYLASTATGFGTAPQIAPQDEEGTLFYVDGFSTLPMLFDEDGYLVDDFINVPSGTTVQNNEGETTTLHTGLNGLQEFQVGEEYFLIMVATHTISTPPSAFALYKFADEARTFDGLEPLWYFPNDGLGSATISCRTAVPSVEVNGNTATISIYAVNNGYASYTLTVDDSNAPIRTEETATACDSYTWNGKTYTQSGTYTYTTTAANGNDSIVTLHLTISPILYTEETISACDSYVWNGQTYTEGGTYTYTTTSVAGCDSIVTLHLTIGHSEVGETEYATICYGENYTWNGQTYSTAGEYSVTMPNTFGCDSVVTLQLTILPEILTTEEYVAICHGETYTWNGQTYATAGAYTANLSSVLGCDSTAILHLTVLPEVIRKTEYISAPTNKTVNWRGKEYNETGIYYDTVHFVVNPLCDSVIYMLDLTIADNIDSDKYCGDNLTWYYSNGALIITGSGAMYDDPDRLTYRDESWYPARVNNIVLPEAITHIGSVAFADCVNLTNIVIPNKVTSIGDGAFSWTGLQSVTIPASVTELGEQVFETCNDLRTILYEGNPIAINNQTVHPLIGCVHLDTIIAPAALWHCTTADPALEARYGVPHKARYIEVTNGELTKQAMKYIAKNSGTVEVLDLSAATNTTLPLGALLNNYRLSTLYLPDQIEVIPEMLAEGCYNLLEILIPANVTEIGNYAFAGCTNVWRMTVEAVLPPKVYDKTFDGIARSISLIVPAGSEELYRQAEYWKEFFIDDTHSQSPKSNCQKILHEDHILILREGKVYTTMGQLVK